MDINELIEKLSPLKVDLHPSSLTLGVSKRFLLFELLNYLKKKIEDDPHLNFISILKYYKVMGNLLHGSIYELHRDRNKAYFKDFFFDPSLYGQVRDELEWVYKANKRVRVTITKRGMIIYDNYKNNKFNMLLLTTHAGTWMPNRIGRKQHLTPEDRYLEEDIDTDRLYCSLVLKKSGIWINNKMSRFACDYNRRPDKAIYREGSEEWVQKIWKQPLSLSDRRWLMKGYEEFYFFLEHLIDTYRFNIVFDCHSMKNAEGRADISFGTRFVPKFYLPVVDHMNRKLAEQDYFGEVKFNAPFKGGYILNTLSSKFPYAFILSLEVNKRLYMAPGRHRVILPKLRSTSKVLYSTFDELSS